MENGQFGDGLMVRGKHLVFLTKSGDHSPRAYEELVLAKPQLFFWPHSFDMTGIPKPILNNTYDDIKIISMQKSFNVFNGHILRIEHIFQPGENSAKAAEIVLATLLPGFAIESVTEYMAGGDVPITSFNRMSWKTENDSKKVSKENPDCSLDNWCLEVAPGDLKTILLVGKFK